MTTEPADRQALPPRRVEVTVEWHAAPLARLATNTRRALALGLTALLVAAGALVVTESPSGGSRGTPAVLVPRGFNARCAYSSTPRVFVDVPARYAVIAVHAPKCP